MTEQAINHYKHGISHDIFKEPVTTYAQLSINALEKQIPKKPVHNTIDRCNCCPVCGSPFTFYGAYRTFEYKSHFCSYCGQSIDWSK